MMAKQNGVEIKMLYFKNFDRLKAIWCLNNKIVIL